MELSILVSVDEVGNKKWSISDLTNQIEVLKGVKVQKIVELKGATEEEK